MISGIVLRGDQPTGTAGYGVELYAVPASVLGRAFEISPDPHTEDRAAVLGTGPAGLVHPGMLEPWLLNRRTTDGLGQFSMAFERKRLKRLKTRAEGEDLVLGFVVRAPGTAGEALNDKAWFRRLAADRVEDARVTIMLPAAAADDLNTGHADHPDPRGSGFTVIRGRIADANIPPRPIAGVRVEAYLTTEEGLAVAVASGKSGNAGEMTPLEFDLGDGGRRYINFNANGRISYSVSGADGAFELHISRERMNAIARDARERLHSVFIFTRPDDLERGWETGRRTVWVLRKEIKPGTGFLDVQLPASVSTGAAPDRGWPTALVADSEETVTAAPEKGGRFGSLWAITPPPSHDAGDGRHPVTMFNAGNGGGGVSNGLSVEERTAPPSGASGEAPLTVLQKRAIQAIVNIFETGHVLGDYAKITLLPGDPGHLTYGRSQTTLASGNLYLLVKEYAAQPDAQYRSGLERYLATLSAPEFSLDHDMEFRGLLQAAGTDPVMHRVQDAFFDRVYWAPARRAAEALGITMPLSYAVVYDSHVHGSWGRMRRRTDGWHGTLREIGEKVWIRHYVEERRRWLSTHPIRILHNTVYRMDAFRRLMSEGIWMLALPFSVRGLSITEELLNVWGAPPSASAAFGERLLRLRQPPTQGADVRSLQESLQELGHEIRATGIFDKATETAVIAFQKAEGLAVDGIAGPATRGTLEAVLEVRRAKEGDRLLGLRPPPLRGVDVGALQDALCELGYDLECTGTFDQATKDAVIAFQKAGGFVVDGIAGPQTRAGLQRALRRARENVQDVPT